VEVAIGRRAGRIGEDRDLARHDAG
jgi:hypothetical protein